MSFPPIPSKENRKRIERSEHKSKLALCIIRRGGAHRGSGFLVERISGDYYLVTSKEVIPKDVGDTESMNSYRLEFRESVIFPMKFTEMSLDEIAELSKPIKPRDDTSGIIVIHLSSKSKKFRKELKGRPFMCVEQDLQNAENLYLSFVEKTSDSFVKMLRFNQDGSGNCTVEEEGSSHTTYESLVNRVVSGERRPLGGAILKDPQRVCQCVGMLDFKDDEAKTLLPVSLLPILQRAVHDGTRGSCAIGGSPTIQISVSREDFFYQGVVPQDGRPEESSSFSPYVTEKSFARRKLNWLRRRLRGRRRSPGTEGENQSTEVRESSQDGSPSEDGQEVQ